MLAQRGLITVGYIVPNSDNHEDLVLQNELDNTDGQSTVQNESCGMAENGSQDRHFGVQSQQECIVVGHRKCKSKDGRSSTRKRRPTKEGLPQPGQPYECLGCGKTFKARNNLTKHGAVHSDVRPFGCQECGKWFKKKRDLSDHLMTHSNVKPYECTECSRPFARKCHLNRHFLVHSNVRAYKCKECGKDFQTSSHSQ
ncbi:zinc finger protein 253-like [Ptychodera flava]|uniref:zinc finger protein 253-like n=1 Tax=Ptychodera flava TaxID=63121 RepID=UPI00396A2C4B